MFVIGSLPLKEMMLKMTMQAVIILITHLDNELFGVNLHMTADNKRFIDFEVQDFVMGFDRRILLLMSNAFILNSPKDLLNGTLLKKLIKTGNTIRKNLENK